MKGDDGGKGYAVFETLYFHCFSYLLISHHLQIELSFQSYVMRIKGHLLKLMGVMTGVICHHLFGHEQESYQDMNGQ